MMFSVIMACFGITVGLVEFSEKGSELRKKFFIKELELKIRQPQTNDKQASPTLQYGSIIIGQNFRESTMSVNGLGG